MKTILTFSFSVTLSLALLLLTLQFFLTPLYLEMEYEFAGFPASRPLTSDERYIAAQAFLSYMNVEIGGATLLSLSEIKHAAQPLFNADDLGCILRAKELRATAFGLTFVTGLVTIAIGLFLAVDDFERTRHIVIVGALTAILVFTGLSLLVRFFFEALTPLLLALIAGDSCAPATVSGLPLIFPPMIFRDALILLALFARFVALFVAVLAFLFGFISRRAQKT
jgi:hypothetical protein